MNKILFLLFFVTSAHAMTLVEQQQALSIHNELRAKHNAPKMQWDTKLADYAEKHGANCEFKHSYGEHGENLAAGYASIRAAIQGWYDENKFYSYQQPKFSSRTGHFTQLVWKSSTRLGCALVACNGKHGTPGNFLICEYDPAGNITNEPYFKENVSEA